MSSLKVLIAGAVFLFLAILGGASMVSAHDFRSGDDIVIGEDEIINDTLFLAGDTVSIRGEVFGDIFCATNNLNISGKVHGDIICAVQKAEIHGDIEGDVRIAGQSIYQSSQVSGSVSVASDNYRLEEDGKIGQDLSLAVSDATINGTLERDLAVAAGSVSLNGKIGRTIRGSLESLRLNSGAEVAGDVMYTSQNDLSKADDAVISGEVTRNAPSQNDRISDWLGVSARFAGYAFFAMLLTSLVLALLFPRRIRQVSEEAYDSPFKTLVVGVAASVLVPIAIVLLFITVFGIPLAVLAIFVWLVIAMLSGPLTGFYLGRVIVPNAQKAVVTMLIGSVVLLALYFVPVLGFFVMLFAYWLGTGMILLYILHAREKDTETIGAKKKRVAKTKA